MYNTGGKNPDHKVYCGVYWSQCAKKKNHNNPWINTIIKLFDMIIYKIFQE